MSLLAADLRAVGQGLANRVAAAAVALRRVTPAVALIRLLVAGSLLGAWALALPVDYLLSRTVVLPIAVAVAAALFPRTRAVGGALMIIAALWVVATGATNSPPLWKVLTLAALLYVAHASAALAAVIPYDCAVAPSALTKWASRTALVVAASLVVGAAGLALTGELALTRGVVGPTVGSLVAAGVVAVLVWQLRRRPRSRPPSS